MSNSLSRLLSRSVRTVTGKAKLAAVVLATGGVLLSTTGAASAATTSAPVSYAYSYNACTNWQDGANSQGIIDLSRPISVLNYTGTSYLYWAAQVQILVNGRWYVVGNYAGAYAHIWGHSGTSLTPIYWADKANNYGVSLPVPSGHSYRVVGLTYWWNGKSWFLSNSSLVVACNF